MTAPTEMAEFTRRARAARLHERDARRRLRREHPDLVREIAARETFDERIRDLALRVRAARGES